VTALSFDSPNELAIDKLDRLATLLGGLDRVVVAFSGGVDSAFLLRVAKDALDDRVVAFTAHSASLMEAELSEAVALAKDIGVEHRVQRTFEMERAGYVENSPLRCYHCRTELFTASGAFLEAMGEHGVVVDGVNMDDLSDFRPGHRAAKEHGVRHPLAEVGLYKKEIRALSKHLGLPTWNKPQLACLSSRIPHGTEVTVERLRRIEAVEMVLRDLGFFDVRARLVADNEDMVRIEVGAAELSRLVSEEVRSVIVRRAKEAGFRFITLDLEGFRSGRMTEGLGKLPILDA